MTKAGAPGNFLRQGARTPGATCQRFVATPRRRTCREGKRSRGGFSTHFRHKFSVPAIPHRWTRDGTRGPRAPAVTLKPPMSARATRGEALVGRGLVLTGHFHDQPVARSRHSDRAEPLGDRVRLAQQVRSAG